jgi:hypothetical protein
LPSVGPQELPEPEWPLRCGHSADHEDQDRLFIGIEHPALVTCLRVLQEAEGQASGGQARPSLV